MSKDKKEKKPVGRPKKRKPNDPYVLKCFFGRQGKYCFPVYKTKQLGFKNTHMGQRFAVEIGWEKGKIRFDLYKKIEDGNYDIKKIEKVNKKITKTSKN